MQTSGKPETSSTAEESVSVFVVSHISSSLVTSARGHKIRGSKTKRIPREEEKLWDPLSRPENTYDPPQGALQGNVGRRNQQTNDLVRTKKLLYDICILQSAVDK